MSDTPRTDAAAWRGSDLGLANAWASGIWNLARELERELTAKTAEVERLREAIKQQASLLPLIPTAPAGTYARGYDSGMRDTITAMEMALEPKK